MAAGSAPAPERESVGASFSLFSFLLAFSSSFGLLTYPLMQSETQQTNMAPPGVSVAISLCARGVQAAVCR